MPPNTVVSLPEVSIGVCKLQMMGLWCMQTKEY